MSLFAKFAPLAELRAQLAARGSVPSVATPMDAVHSATEAVIDGRRVLLAGTNNYLGLTFAPETRAAAIEAIKNEKRPAKTVTVFAGMEKDAVDKARSYMLPYPPSSPAMALFKDGKLVHMIERHQIEGRPAQMIADNLVAAFDEYC